MRELLYYRQEKKKDVNSSFKSSKSLQIKCEDSRANYITYYILLLSLVFFLRQTWTPYPKPTICQPYKFVVTRTHSCWREWGRVCREKFILYSIYTWKWDPWPIDFNTGTILSRVSGGFNLDARHEKLQTRCPPACLPACLVGWLVGVYVYWNWWFSW